MSTVSQIIAGLLRRPLRTFLTALGTALGIATIVAMLAVADGAQKSADQLYHLGASDIGLFQGDAGDPTTSVLPLSLIPRLLKTPGISAASPLLLMVEQIPKDLSAVVFGTEPNDFEAKRMVFVDGHMFSGPNDIVVGDQLAQTLHLKLGSPVKVGGHKFSVVGIYHLGVTVQDGGAFVPLKTAEAITGKTDEATTIAVKLAVGTKPDAEQKYLQKHIPGLTVLNDTDEAPRAGANATLLSKMAVVIGALALIIGGIGVMNTMLMSVIERRTEFALLAAVGWSPRQIATRVLIEGVLTTIVGTALGLLLGVIGAGALVHLLGAGELVSPDVTPWDLGDSLLVGVLLGVLGGLYPAWRATRVSPAKVLAAR